MDIITVAINLYSCNHLKIYQTATDSLQPLYFWPSSCTNADAQGHVPRPFINACRTGQAELLKI